MNAYQIRSVAGLAAAAGLALAAVSPAMGEPEPKGSVARAAARAQQNKSQQQPPREERKAAPQPQQRREQAGPQRAQQRAPQPQSQPREERKAAPQPQQRSQPVPARVEERRAAPSSSIQRGVEAARSRSQPQAEAPRAQAPPRVAERAPAQPQPQRVDAPSRAQQPMRTESTQGSVLRAAEAARSRQQQQTVTRESEAKTSTPQRVVNVTPSTQKQATVTAPAAERRATQDGAARGSVNRAAEIARSQQQTVSREGASTARVVDVTPRGPQGEIATAAAAERRVIQNDPTLTSKGSVLRGAEAARGSASRNEVARTAARPERRDSNDRSAAAPATPSTRRVESVQTGTRGGEDRLPPGSVLRSAAIAQRNVGNRPEREDSWDRDRREDDRRDNDRDRVGRDDGRRGNDWTNDRRDHDRDRWGHGRSRGDSDRLSIGISIGGPDYYFGYSSGNYDRFGRPWRSWDYCRPTYWHAPVRWSACDDWYRSCDDGWSWSISYSSSAPLWYHRRRSYSPAFCWDYTAFSGPWCAPTVIELAPTAVYLDPGPSVQTIYAYDPMRLPIPVAMTQAAPSGPVATVYVGQGDQGEMDWSAVPSGIIDAIYSAGPAERSEAASRFLAKQPPGAWQVTFEYEEPSGTANTVYCRAITPSQLGTPPMVALLLPGELPALRPGMQLSVSGRLAEILVDDPRFPAGLLTLDNVRVAN